MTETETPQSAPPEKPQENKSWFARRMGLILVLSLAVNLFFVGLVAGRILSPHGGPPPFVPTAMFGGPGGAYEGLGVDYRNRAFRKLEDRSGELRGQFSSLREAREAVTEAMLAEPFDRDRLAEAFAELRAASEQTQASLHELLADTAEGLPAEERQSLLRGLSRRHGRDGRDGRGDH